MEQCPCLFHSMVIRQLTSCKSFQLFQTTLDRCNKSLCGARNPVPQTNHARNGARLQSKASAPCWRHGGTTSAAAAPACYSAVPCHVADSLSPACRALLFPLPHQAVEKLPKRSSQVHRPPTSGGDFCKGSLLSTKLSHCLRRCKDEFAQLARSL